MSEKPATPRVLPTSENARARLRATEAALSFADSSDRLEAFARGLDGMDRTELLRLVRGMRRQARLMLKQALETIE